MEVLPCSSKEVTRGYPLPVHYHNVAGRCHLRNQWHTPRSLRSPPPPRYNNWIPEDRGSRYGVFNPAEWAGRRPLPAIRRRDAGIAASSR